MSVFDDMREMHEKYGVIEWVSENRDKLDKFLEFRLNFLYEELEETAEAIKNKDAEEVVDGLIDLIVIAAGTLDLFEVDGQIAWDEVYDANMKKVIGVKASRPNPLKLPDLVKPDDWVPPNHSNNHGILFDES